MAEKTKDTMALWNQVCETDPAITSTVNRRGGFTAIDAQAQIKRATELWGPYGGDWGMKNCKYEYIRDAGDGTGNILEAILEATFYCPVAEFEISTDIAYVPGNDSRKKLLTDATTKALSKLGFNSDVFEGKFDGDKYKSGVSKPETAKSDRQIKSDSMLITPAQVRLFHTIRGRAGVSEEEAHKILNERFKCSSVRNIQRAWFHEVLEAIKAAGNGNDEDIPF